MTHKKNLPTNHPFSQNTHPFNSLFRSFFGDDMDLILEDRAGMRSHHPNISLSEDETHIYVDAALPGLSPEEIEVTVEQGVLWIRGQHKAKEDNKRYHYKAERNYSYKMVLPESADETIEAEAKYENGILQVIFQKALRTSPKRIQIK